MLFSGNCQQQQHHVSSRTATVRSVPVLHKHIKLSSRKMAYHERLATQRLGKCGLSNSEVHVWDGGVNYLTVAKLVNYENLHLPKPLTATFLQSYLIDVGSQLECLHQGDYWHFDVYNANIMSWNSSMRQPNETISRHTMAPPQFQLIDTSSSIPMTGGGYYDWESALSSVLRGRNKQHLPVPPGLVCRLNHPTPKERIYCETKQSKQQPCLEWMDRYSLGVQALRIVYAVAIGKPLRRLVFPPHGKDKAGFSTMQFRIAQHSIHVTAVEEVKRLLLGTHTNSNTSTKAIMERGWKKDYDPDFLLLQTIAELIISDNRTSSSCH